jgi:integrase
MKHLTEIEDLMLRDLKRFFSIIDRFEERGEDYSSSDIAETFYHIPQERLLRAYAAKLSAQLMECGQDRTAIAYRSAVNSIIRFYGKKDLRLEQINAALMGQYEIYLKDKNLKLNTISFYMRNLRAIYNKAIEEGIISARQEKPFARVATGVYPTQKRALSKEETQELSALASNPNLSPDLRDALFFFLFCCHACGMSFIDMTYLKKTDVREGTIYYIRRKTGKGLSVKITPPMQRIIDYFAPRTKDSPYLFPLIKPTGKERKQYERTLHKQNKQLKILGKMAGIEKPLTTHVSRHTWATLAHAEQVPVALISEALGHRDEKTTTIYLDSFNQSVMARLSEMISTVIG